MKNEQEIVIITGMSGAGKTVAMQAFEDMGFLTTDNLPIALLGQFFKMLQDSQSVQKVALVVDARSMELLGSIDEMWKNKRATTKILFLDANEQELVARYKESRRQHPLAPDGRVLEGIEKERNVLEGIKNHADILINTGDLSNRQLRKILFAKFSDGTHRAPFNVQVMSFGFKYGLPLDADLVWDVRFLTNPFYDPSLRDLTGLDQPVYDYVMQTDGAEEFFQNYVKLLNLTIPRYISEGKTSLVIAIGCTGGQHRSVAFAERIGRTLEANYQVRITHRDIELRKESSVKS
ncbi:RNase adapter RapZ [Periweissella fabaria]|uniref:Nucleotide-binding protein YvcJ n=1 Tax=Periweissella fabaria TaxID=546157 RepID=A0ABN8BI71_9LACO|nr:RNase adapter RapZ [Periweissella fabaria]MCM0597967.1 RNase adapter RapZ [Periweissella fabaria]CAH0417432.1 Nucleotide-binding protein YvcJ [Periweissella fabaria]